MNSQMSIMTPVNDVEVQLAGLDLDRLRHPILKMGIIGRRSPAAPHRVAADLPGPRGRARPAPPACRAGGTAAAAVAPITYSDVRTRRGYRLKPRRWTRWRQHLGTQRGPNVKVM